MQEMREEVWQTLYPFEEYRADADEIDAEVKRTMHKTGTSYRLAWKKVLAENPEFAEVQRRSFLGG